MNKQRADLKEALFIGMAFKKTMALIKAKKEDEKLIFPVHQLQVELHYSMMIANIKRTNHKVLKPNGFVDKRRAKRFGLKGKSYLIKGNG